MRCAPTAAPVDPLTSTTTSTTSPTTTDTSALIAAPSGTSSASSTPSTTSTTPSTTSTTTTTTPTTTTTTPTTTTTTTNPQMTAPTPTPPQIVNFTAVASGGNNWVFSGDVHDSAPGGLAVALGGQPASLQGVTVTTDANGHFNTVITLQTNGTDTGTATAQTKDAAGLQSNVASCMVSP